KGVSVVTVIEERGESISLMYPVKSKEDEVPASMRKSGSGARTGASLMGRTSTPRFASANAPEGSVARTLRVSDPDQFGAAHKSSVRSALIRKTTFAAPRMEKARGSPSTSEKWDVRFPAIALMSTVSSSNATAENGVATTGG